MGNIFNKGTAPPKPPAICHPGPPPLPPPIPYDPENLQVELIFDVVHPYYTEQIIPNLVLYAKTPGPSYGFDAIVEIESFTFRFIQTFHLEIDNEQFDAVLSVTEDSWGSLLNTQWDNIKPLVMCPFDSGIYEYSQPSPPGWKAEAVWRAWHL